MEKKGVKTNHIKNEVKIIFFNHLTLTNSSEKCRVSNVDFKNLIINKDKYSNDLTFNNSTTFEKGLISNLLYKGE